MENSQHSVNSPYLAACTMTASLIIVVISHSNARQHDNKLLLSCHPPPFFFKLKEFPCSKHFSLETTYIFLSVSLGEEIG